ncbi:putative TATA box-binding protein-associated factor RNA polymerase I subunit C [Scophthalmus maximus]|uniref:Putative TATA box-binding protein-associated factor RNA polymerase I subunit C n=1 Tax=Scophthalmus maximus TaxID=52904 RepID=A0A2U9CGN6_SCOMX|nr:putative TATA box-binding protein-associated factor RNA polymerase I subunit C [Scophthalmus maximus]
MDHQFPPRLFPSFYSCGPPDAVPGNSAGAWGRYERVGLQAGSGPGSSWIFTSSHQVRGETWRQTEPVPVPLLSPRNHLYKYIISPGFLWPVKPPDPLDFKEHMQNFFMDHCGDAFGCMGEILGENFNFAQRRKPEHRRDSVNMGKVKNILDKLEYKICHKVHHSIPLNKYILLLSDVVHSVPPDLLGSLLHEELTEQRDRMLFSEAATGGALTFVPFSPSGGTGCLVYPGSQGLNELNFHSVELQHHRGGSSALTSSSDRFSFQLKGPIRQISSASLFNNCCVAVRSDHLCGIWSFSDGVEPRLLQVVDTREVATCVSASPHVLGEVLVASESGAVNLWTVGKGMQKVREDNSNLFFNATSPWRWCEFSAHPRVMVYADRTGAELTDMRMNPFSGHALFRISSTAECRRGERLILSRYLGDAHPFHHLVTTHLSAYIVDERFPCVPMLKWDHMMQSAPLFCHVLPGSASSDSGAGGARSTKVVLGSHSSQEITLLQYSGGRAEACFSRGPPQALLRPRDSLGHLPVQIPHRLDVATHRLSSAAAGLTCVEQKGEGSDCLCVLQLTEAGDIFYQILEPEQPDDDKASSRLPAALDDEQTATSRSLAPIDSSEPSLSTVTLVTWKRWLQKLMRKSRDKKLRPRRSQNITTTTKGLLRLPADRKRDSTEDELVRSVRRDLRTCMSDRSLLLRGAVSSSLAALDPVPLPDTVDTDAWSDPLSRRLTLSWQGGEEVWRAWWADEMGLNRAEKERALRRKRRREKEAKRATGRRLELRGDQRSPSIKSLSQMVKPVITPANQRSRRLTQDALLALQDERSQLNVDPPEQLSFPTRNLGVGLSGRAPLRASVSQWLSLSQGSQGRPGPASQAKKRKSRMGF